MAYFRCGHESTVDNRYANGAGKVRCRTCILAGYARKNEKRRKAKNKPCVWPIKPCLLQQAWKVAHMIEAASE